MVKAFDPRRAYFTLDDFGVLDQAERHPDALLNSRPVTLDEVQRTPPLLLAVKRAVDERRQAGDFLLTGSATLLLMGHVADTSAGRAIYLDLEIKTGSTVTSSDADGIRIFRDSLEKNQKLVRGVVLHAGRTRPLDTRASWPCRGVGWCPAHRRFQKEPNKEQASRRSIGDGIRKNGQLT